MTALLWAHVESIHVGGPAQILRLGPLLPLVLVSIWAVAVACGRPVLGSGAAVAFVSAGLVHLALSPEHAAESFAAGAFFVIFGVAQVAVGAWLWRGATKPVSLAAAAITVMLLIVYVAARLFRLPFSEGKDTVEAIGLITKALELAGSSLALWSAFVRWRPPTLTQGPLTVVALSSVALAVTARPLLAEGPSLPQAMAAISAAVIAGALWGDGRRRLLLVAVADGGAVAVLLRADSIGTFLLVGLATGALRALARQLDTSSLAPAALGLLVLLLTSTESRLQILHVGHASEPVPALIVFVIGLVLGWAAWQRGCLPLVAGFYLAYLAGQAVRMSAGLTSIEAVEIPTASLGLFLIVVVILADVEVPLSGARGAVVGISAGFTDVVLRHLAVPYSPLLAVAVTVAALDTIPPYGILKKRRGKDVVPCAATRSTRTDWTSACAGSRARCGAFNA